ncbi:hypothetical protein MTO96_047265 [Rhipicephalus appendiculatus]
MLVDPLQIVRSVTECGLGYRSIGWGHSAHGALQMRQITRVDTIKYTPTPVHDGIRCHVVSSELASDRSADESNGNHDAYSSFMQR